MIECFNFKGIPSTTLGVLMSDEWIYTKATQGYESIEIEGKDGAIITPTGFKLVERNVECTLLNRKRLNDVIAWLTGTGILEFAGRYRKASVFGEINYNVLGFQKNKFTIPFIMDPFWYKKDGYIAYEDGDIVENDGNYAAVPLIQISGTGNGVVTVGGVDIQVFDLKSGETIEIDCLEMNENMSKKVGLGFEYPRLMPGKNDIAIKGNFVLKIKRKDRWLG